MTPTRRSPLTLAVAAAVSDVMIHDFDRREARSLAKYEFTELSAGGL